MRKAVIMAGGKGTRLAKLNKDIPKPMFEVLSRPILEYQIESLKKSGITSIIMIIGHLGDVIKEYFGDGVKWGVDISYIVEETPLGTAGALYYLNGKIDDDFLLVFGDLILDVDFNKFMSYHKEKKGSLTLFGHPNSHPYDSDIIMRNDDGLVTGIDSKKNDRSAYCYENFVNAGLYCVSPKVIEALTEVKKIDLEKELITSYIEKGEVYAYKSTEYVKDMGTPDRLAMVQKDVESGVLEGRSLMSPQKVIYVDDFEVVDGISDAIKAINESGYLAIVICKSLDDDLETSRRKIDTALGNKGAYVDALFFYKNTDEEKAEIINKANNIYNVDKENSWYIGSSNGSLMVGKSEGFKTVSIKSGVSFKLLEAVKNVIA